MNLHLLFHVVFVERKGEQKTSQRQEQKFLLWFCSEVILMLSTANLREGVAVRNEKADGYGPQMDLATLMDLVIYDAQLLHRHN